MTDDPHRLLPDELREALAEDSEEERSASELSHEFWARG